MKLSDGRIIGAIAYSNGVVGLLFLQEELDEILPVLMRKYPELQKIEALYGNYTHKTDSHDEHWQREYQIPVIT